MLFLTIKNNVTIKYISYLFLDGPVSTPPTGEVMEPTTSMISSSVHRPVATPTGVVADSTILPSTVVPTIGKRPRRSYKWTPYYPPNASVDFVSKYLAKK